MAFDATALSLRQRGKEEAMAYVSYDQAPSARAIPRVNAPRLAWGRLAMIGTCVAFWVGVAFAIRAIF
jgi:hypothetical protein